MQDQNNNNRKMEITGEITSVTPGQSVALKLWSDGMFDGTAAYTLVDLGNNKTAWKPPEHATTTTPSPVC
jgi:hypothetical protein